MDLILKPTYKQHLAYEAMRDPLKEVIFLGGGAGGGKSWWLCESRLLNAIRYPGYKSFIGREELKRLMQSTYVTWIKVCRHHGIPDGTWKLNGQYNFIEFINPKTGQFDGSGSRIDLLDLKFLPGDPLYERFGSLEYTDGAIEEAGEVDFMAYDVLKSRVGRHLNREFNIRPTLAITGNPKDNWTKRTFYIPWKQGTLPENVSFIQSLYRDNPYTAEDYGKQLRGISDPSNRARLMSGDWNYDKDPNLLIKNSDFITDLWTLTIPESKEKFLTGDIARHGSDYTVIIFWEGLLVRKVWMYQKNDTKMTEDNIRTILTEKMIPWSQCILDEDGIGGGVIDHLSGVQGFIANTAAYVDPDEEQPEGMKKENFASLKSQCAFKLADYINTHMIAFAKDFDIDTNIEGMNLEKFKDMLTEELKQLKQKDPDKDIPLRIIPKEDMKEAIGRSPDILDNFIMRMKFELKAQIPVSYGSMAGGVGDFYPELGL